MIVKEYKFGNTTVKIDDSEYINRTQEEIQQTLDSIKRLAIKILEREARKE